MILPIVRFETPYLAWFQEKVRTPTLDTYFAFTANLGTHTFFTIFIPLLFWCGYARFGHAIVHLLASGVFFSGFMKDLLCLPRPLSPPLQRISMSESAALEYGFPSTHSTNAVSVATYILFLLRSPDSTLSARTTLMFEGLTYLYVCSILIGRLYCGMHGFLDVIVGSTMGILITYFQCTYGDAYDDHILSGSAKDVFLVALVILALVRIHPEPADDCPCFDDSVAFAGVLLGEAVAHWHFGQASSFWDLPYPSTAPYRIEYMGWPRTILRLCIGVLMVFAWREIMKPSLLQILPPIFRALEKAGLDLPRRFFTKASEYKNIPAHLHDHDVLPDFSEIPSILSTIRRRRAISVGPQSEADAYETLAYREKRRHDNLADGGTAPPAAEADHKHTLYNHSKIDEYEHMMGTGSPCLPPTGATTSDVDTTPLNQRTSPENDVEEFTEAELFSRIAKPRVRYDVEVVTKLIVYSGISFIVIEAAPILFSMTGLSVQK